MDLALSLLFVYFAFLTAVVWLWILAARAIASAAFRKGRSYRSFFWLTFALSPLLLALIVATLPFDASDPAHPNNIRINSPELADKYSGRRSNRTLNVGFAIAVAALVVIGILAGAVGSSISSSGTSFSSSDSSGTDTSSGADNSDALAAALTSNCTTAPTTITATTADDGVAGDYFAFGDDNSSGTFNMTDDGSGNWNIVADSNDDITSTWGCDASFSVSQ